MSKHRAEDKNEGDVTAERILHTQYIPPDRRLHLKLRNEQNVRYQKQYQGYRPFNNGYAPQDRKFNYGSNNNNNYGSDSFNRSYNGYNNRNSGGGGSRNYGNFGGGGFGSNFNRRPVPDESGLLPSDDRLELDLFGIHSNTGINFDKYQEIPVEAFGEDVPPPCQKFSELDLHPVLKNAIRLCGYETPTPVQQNSLPIILSGRDLMACAQTGSGKTAAFLFPTIGRLLNDQECLPPWDGVARPSALILAPTRELASQIYEEARKFTYRSVLRSVVVYGGADFLPQIHDLRSGCDILVACPGRLIDMINRGRVKLGQCRFLCLDEADRMLDMGFEESIRAIVNNYEMPSGSQRQTLMFSATFPKEIQQLAKDFLNNYVFLKVGRVGSTTESIRQNILHVEDRDKLCILMETIDSTEGLTLVFAETKRQVDEIYNILSSQGYQCTSIHGDRSQNDREAALEAFKSKRKPILVATDVAARGLDIADVAHVINYDMPRVIDDYVHRIGRTGRAGNIGKATGFFNDKNNAILKELICLLKECNQEVPTWLSNKESEISRSSYKGSKSSSNRGYGYSRNSSNSNNYYDHNRYDDHNNFGNNSNGSSFNYNNNRNTGKSNYHGNRNTTGAHWFGSDTRQSR